MYLVIDIGGTFTKYAIMDAESNFVYQDKMPTEQKDLSSFIDSLVELYNRFSKAYEIEGIAISSPGMIDSNTGFMYNGGSLFFIDKINIVEILENRCAVKVSVENDAKCAALAEVWRGSLADCRNSIALILGTAVGGAVIIDKKVLKGIHYMAGEFSYIFTDGKNYKSRSQLLAEQAGVPGLIGLVAEKKKMDQSKLNGEIIFSMVNQGDKEVLEALRVYCRRIAIQISNYQFLIDPEKVAIGGGISVQPILLELIREELRNLGEVFPYTMTIPEVTTCKFFNDSNLIGALYVHLKSKEEKIDVEKFQEFMKFVEGRPEGKRLKEFLTQP